MAAQRLRGGYFGDASASTPSNKGGAPRIVLGDAYGRPRSLASASLGRLGLDDAAVERGLRGCAGRYADRVVIVTGAARGIGEGCARVFFEAGAAVVLVDRDDEGGAALAAELNGQDWSLDEASGRAKFVKADVSVAAELQAAVAATVETFGRVDCVVNNAGWHPPHKPIDDFSVDDVQDLLQLNFVSAFALCKFALPHLRKTGGCVVNVSSLVGHFGQAKACTYAATKGALTAFTKALAIDEAPNGVRVNSVSPGNIWTPLWKAGADADADPAAARAAGDRAQVMGRMGTILEAGRLCLCIAADMTFTTGVDHILSGGAEIGYGMRA
jgi:NAD(P)-dependent dehydrogenase (short-subunit alcohol dehydrogenase family)